MNYYLHLNGNVGTESSASLARLVISMARVQFCPRPFVRHFTPPPVCPQQFQSHKAVGVCRGVCVCASVPAVQLGAAQVGFCSLRPSSTTPETLSAALRRKDCAVDTRSNEIFITISNHLFCFSFLSLSNGHTHTHAHNEVVLQLQAHHFIKT